ncbi:acetyltransferase domain protein, partial [[Clostridium] bifermentans ATCC 19299]
MNNIRLEIPSIKYENSFLEYINDYKVSGDTEYMYVYRDAYKDFKQYVSKLNNNSKGIDLPEGYVPCSSFWLVNDKEQVLGSIRIRHGNVPFDGHIGYDIAPRHRGNGYGNKILELALPHAKEIGLD